MGFRSDLTLQYDEVYRYINTWYAWLFKEAESKHPQEEKDPNLYKNCCYVLNEFLNLYLAYREKSHSSITNTALWGIQKATAMVTFQKNPKTTQDVLDNTVRDIRQIISTVTNFQDVLKLLIYLRQYAEMCQEKKMLSGPSVLCMTLHAMACYLLQTCKNDFKELIEHLEKEKNKLLVTPKEDYEKKNGVNVANLNAQYCLVTFALALLNVFDGVNSASRMNKLPYYQLPSKEEQVSCAKFNIQFNYGLPIIYQDACIYYVYAEWYQAMQYKKFQDFVHDAIAHGKAAEEEALKKRESNKLPLQDWLVAREMPIDVKKLPGTSPSAYVLTPEALWYVDRSSKHYEKLTMTPEALKRFWADSKLPDFSQDAVLFNISDVNSLPGGNLIQTAGNGTALPDVVKMANPIINPVSGPTIQTNAPSVANNPVIPTIDIEKTVTTSANVSSPATSQTNIVNGVNPLLGASKLFPSPVIPAPSLSPVTESATKILTDDVFDHNYKNK